MHLTQVDTKASSDRSRQAGQQTQPARDDYLPQRGVSVCSARLRLLRPPLLDHLKGGSDDGPAEGLGVGALLLTLGLVMDILEEKGRAQVTPHEELDKLQDTGISLNIKQFSFGMSRDCFPQFALQSEISCHRSATK